jgi:replicative DNA helicase
MRDLSPENRYQQPYDPYAEARLLGAVLSGNAGLSDLCDLRPCHFAAQMPEVIYGAAQELLARGEVPHQGAILSTLALFGDTGARYALDCCCIGASKEEVPELAARIRDFAARRALISMAATVLDEAAIVSQRLTAKEILRLAYRKLESVAGVL